MRTLAEHLLASEAGSAATLGVTLHAEPVCNKLRPHLATLMGITGFCALLTRAMARATVTVPGLRAMHVTSDGVIERSATSASQHNLAQGVEDSVALIVELLSLLHAFIGISLTLQLVREIWPELSVNEANFESGDSE